MTDIRRACRLAVVAAALVLAEGKAQTVALKLPVLGRYSDTAPYDCAKSRKILAARDSPPLRSLGLAGAENTP